VFSQVTQTKTGLFAVRTFSPLGVNIDNESLHFEGLIEYKATKIYKDLSDFQLVYRMEGHKILQEEKGSPTLLYKVFRPQRSWKCRLPFLTKMVISLLYLVLYMYFYYGVNKLSI
jgi:hypothetical protein